MAHEGLWATSAECIAKAGDNYNSTNVNEAMINAFCLQAENLINSLTRYNWSDEFSAPATTATLSADVWHMLGFAESNLVAIYMLNYKPTGEDGTMSRIEYEDRVNILRDGFLFAISILRDKKVQKFMREATV